MTIKELQEMARTPEGQKAIVVQSLRNRIADHDSDTDRD